MGTAMRIHHVLQLAESDGEAGTDIVTRRNRPEEVGAADPELLSHRQCGRNNGASGMRLGGWMCIVRLIGMREQTVCQCGFNWTAHNVGTGDGANPVPAIRTCELNREPARRER